MKNFAVFALLFIGLISCNNSKKEIINSAQSPVGMIDNVLDYHTDVKSTYERGGLTFSDEGAWFSFSFQNNNSSFGGFSGPFIMTQENGCWASENISKLRIYDGKSNNEISDFNIEQHSFLSHLEQKLDNKKLIIREKLFFTNSNTAIISTEIENTSTEEQEFYLSLSGKLINKSLEFENKSDELLIKSKLSPALGALKMPGFEISQSDNDIYLAKSANINLESGEKYSFSRSVSFVFPENDLSEELTSLDSILPQAEKYLDKIRLKKTALVNKLFHKIPERHRKDSINILLQKILLTLQNNWRTKAGELKHQGLFPSYHYKWFHGFWAWDSWKHAAALAFINPELAKDQIRAMYDYMDTSGFIPDCIYRDTSIEKHNYRNTKPPLSAWAVMKIFEQDADTGFLREMYPKINNQNYWWDKNRKHDSTGFYEFGSNDGSLIAAKWESGMDNAVRFDKTQMIKNSDKAWLMNQESVDLNSFLAFENKTLSRINKLLGKERQSQIYALISEINAKKINYYLYDTVSNWYYDRRLDSNNLIKIPACEAYAPLFCGLATQDIADSMISKLLDPALFYTQVPFPTLAANNPLFKPNGGYWRGPIWLDQTYFAIKGLINYGYQKEADEAMWKVFRNAKGLMDKGPSIRENYNPLTGEGLEAENFSWSAACLLLMLLEE